MDFNSISDTLPVWTPWVLTAAAFLAALWATAWGLRPLRVTASAPEPESDSDSDSDSSSDSQTSSDTPASSDELNPSDEPTSPAPFLSVIVYASGGDDLTDFLDSLEEQDMTDREIIVVNDAGQEATAALAERHAGRGNLYFTFMPVESRNVSRLKLAYTLGIKAARGEAVLLTTADCRIPSRQWLSQISAPVRESEFTDVALGYCRFDCRGMGVRRWWCEYEDVMTACQWIGSALEGYPYRGDRHNLAFRRRLFFEHDGYSATNHLHTGDDDLFIASIAEAGNTKVVLSAGSILERECGADSLRVWTDRKIRYRFTSKWLPRRAFRFAACARLMQWVALLGAVGGGVAAWCGWHSPWEGLAGVIILAGLWAADITAYRRAAARLGSVRLWWSVVPFMLWQPLAGVLFNLNHRGDRIRNFTWQKLR
ncbi:MAG: glycosyltransferase [Muribaculaceae bacterium]|nr:glycosyltransferase [Muribaculaceae bacterium]